MHEPIPWPLFTLDFEASSLGPGTFPIEVGVCRWLGPTHSLQGWSSLIRPPREWLESGDWWRASEEIHGIKREELASGKDPGEVVSTLNRILDGGIAYVDGGNADLHWARMLVSASSVQPRFELGDFDHLALRLDQAGYMRFMRWIERTPARHRARDDSERLMKALARGLGLEHGSSTDIV